MSTRDVSQLLRVAERTVRYWADVGVLRGYKVGKLWRFKREEVERLPQEPLD